VIIKGGFHYEPLKIEAHSAYQNHNLHLDCQVNDITAFRCKASGTKKGSFEILVKGSRIFIYSDCGSVAMFPMSWRGTLEWLVKTVGVPGWEQLLVSRLVLDGWSSSPFIFDPMLFKRNMLTILSADDEVNGPLSSSGVLQETIDYGSARVHSDSSVNPISDMEEYSMWRTSLNNVDTESEAYIWLGRVFAVDAYQLVSNAYELLPGYTRTLFALEKFVNLYRERLDADKLAESLLNVDWDRGTSST
jgi:hypothetical protein